MKNDHEFELLRKVEKVDAPPFLLTRIQAKINALEADKMPFSWQLSGVFAIGLTLIINFTALQNFLNRPSNTLDGVANSMQLNPNLQLYADAN